MHIIATIGPKSSDKWVLKEIIDKGVDIVRLNFSHFHEAEFKGTIDTVRQINKNVKILADLCGKKIRISEKLESIYKIYNGEEVYFCGEDIYEALNLKDINDMKFIPLNISGMLLSSQDIMKISMKDDTMRFKVKENKNGILKVEVERGGIIRQGKGCNIPALKREDIDLTEKDKRDIIWAIQQGVDIICQSYVENKEDILEVQKYINNNLKEKGPTLWAKVETPEGIGNLKEFYKLVDGVVIGRGDLLPESGVLDAVKFEYDALETLISNNKTAIIATHLLSSMAKGERAILPEVESIYNFIRHGVSGFMLAGETSVGKAPIKTVQFLKLIIEYYKKEK